MKFGKKIWVALLVLCLLTPVGIFLPEIFNAGDAWGEWDTETVKEKVGYVPEGMKKDAELWNAPVPDYSFEKEPKNLFSVSLNYIISALAGIAIIFVLTLLLLKYYNRNGQ